MKVTTRHYDGVNLTPAVPLLARAQHELIADRLSIPQVMVFWDDQAIVGFVDRGSAAHPERAMQLPPPLPVGVISYRKFSRMIDINIGYVLPEFRRQGVYRVMWDALVLKAQELEVAQIVGTTHVHNDSMKQTAEALCRYVGGYVIRYEVPPKA